MICILTWNKDKWPESEMQDMMDRFHAGEEVVDRWKCGAYKRFGPGDRAFLSRTGRTNPGLVGSGVIISAPRLEPDFENAAKMAWCVDVKFDTLSLSPSQVIISHKELAANLNVPARVFTPQKCGTPYHGSEQELEALWQILTGTDYPGEISTAQEKEYTEGAVKEVKVNRYERDSRARLACIAYHGAECKACGIDLNKVYGADLAKNYIHVHHLVPLKNLRKEYNVDPVNDLIPLCPNCHAMAHQTDPALSVEELRVTIWDQYRKLFSVVPK